MLKIRGLRGQSLAELSLLFAIIIGAFVAMQLYLQRSLQARYRDISEYPFAKISQEAEDRHILRLSEPKKQYDPYYRESNITETKSVDSVLGFPDSSINETSSRQGQERIGINADED